MTRRASLAACLLIAAFTAASWWPRITGPIDLRWDGGAYYLIGTSLVKGDGYRLASEPGSPRSTVHAPFLPAYVAAHQWLLGTADPAIVGPALRLSAVAFSVAYSIAIFLLLRAHLPVAFAVFAALLGVLQPQFIYFSDALYAETFYGLFTVVLFLLQAKRARLAGFLSAGVFAVLAYAARTAGIALLVAWVADRLLKRDFKRAALALVIAALPVVGWMGWIAAVERSPERREPAYAYQFAPFVYFNVSYAKNIFTLADPSNPQLGALTTAKLVERVTANVRALPARIGESVSSWAAPRWLSLPLGLLVAIGLARLALRGQYLIPMYVVLSLAAICLTPFSKQFIRYLMPLYPFFVLGLFGCLLPPAAPGGRRFGVPAGLWHAAAGLVAATLAWHALKDTRGLYEHHDPVHDARGSTGTTPGPAARLFHYAPLGTEFDESLDWLRGQARRTDIVAATDPQWAHLRTGLKAVLPPFELDGARAQRLVDSVPVRFLIVETGPQRLGLGAYHRFTSALLRDNAEHWRRVWSSSKDNIAVYERNDPAAATR